jgi:hypothetical protein
LKEPELRDLWLDRQLWSWWTFCRLLFDSRLLWDSGFLLRRFPRLRLLAQLIDYPPPGFVTFDFIEELGPIALPVSDLDPSFFLLSRGLPGLECNRERSDRTPLAFLGVDLGLCTFFILRKGQPFPSVCTPVFNHLGGNVLDLRRYGLCLGIRYFGKFLQAVDARGSEPGRPVRADAVYHCQIIALHLV